VPRQLYEAFLRQEQALPTEVPVPTRAAILQTAVALVTVGPELDVAEAKERLAALPRPTATATPRPAPTARTSRSFVASVTRSFPNTGNSNRFESCVSGRVVDRNNRGVAAAVGAVNNGDRNFEWTTNADGFYSRCGLGASNWSSVLFFVPGSPGLANQPKQTVYVNGDPAQQAVVNFQER
jgi:hypothetical protein